MKKFSQQLYPTVREETFFAPCGVADLIATCYGGRNRLVAMEYTRLVVVRTHSQSGWDAEGGGVHFRLACVFVLGTWPGFSFVGQLGSAGSQGARELAYLLAWLLTYMAWVQPKLSPLVNG
jgi:hypothetical protein